MNPLKELNPNSNLSIFETKEESTSNITPAMIKADMENNLAKMRALEAEKAAQEAADALAKIFPLDVFPAYQQQAIESLYQDLNYPKEFTAAAMLYAASVAIGNTYRVEVKNGWQEGACIYLALVARPGTNKTHPLSFAIEPIEERDKKTFYQYEQLRKEYDKAIALSKKEREENGIAEPVRPVWMKHLLTDYTPEGLAEVHKYNKRGIGVYADELAGWFKNFNKYNKGSETEFWLSAFSGRPITIDRKTVEPTYISQPFISVAGTIQTGLLLEMAKDRTQNGFMDRILFVYPDDIKKPYFSETELSPAVMQRWKNTIARLIYEPVSLDENNCAKPEVLRFNREARAAFIAWQKTNADECNQAETDALAGIYSKLEIYTIRLALILQMLYWASAEGDKTEITVRAVKGAIKLTEYFRRSAYKVHNIVSGPNNPLLRLPADKKDFYNALPYLFSTALALEIAPSFGLSVRNTKRFLTDNKDLFKKVSYGEYEKLFFE